MRELKKSKENINESKKKTKESKRRKILIIGLRPASLPSCVKKAPGRVMQMQILLKQEIKRSTRCGVNWK